MTKSKKPRHAASIFLALTDCFPLAITLMSLELAKRSKDL